jgi:hypothetical protein
MGSVYETDKIVTTFYWPQNCCLIQPPPWPQHGISEPQPEPTSETLLDWFPFPLEMIPAPPLISLFTVPPHAGQDSIAGSDIFWRFSKWLPHALHLYSYAGIKQFLSIDPVLVLIIRKRSARLVPQGYCLPGHRSNTCHADR